MQEQGDVKFIRVRGRIVPIRQKKGDFSSKKKDYEKAITHEALHHATAPMTAGRGKVNGTMLGGVGALALGFKAFRRPNAAALFGLSGAIIGGAIGKRYGRSKEDPKQTAKWKAKAAALNKKSDKAYYQAYKANNGRDF